MAHVEQDELTREWLGRVCSLRPILAAAAPRIEQARTLPADVIDAMHAAQMFRMTVPRSVGGAELPPPPFIRKWSPPSPKAMPAPPGASASRRAR